MATYHIKDNGDPGICLARKGNCPKGGAEEHFTSREAARAASEAKLANTFNGGFGKGAQEIPELEPYTFSGENIEAEVEARGDTGFREPGTGRKLTVKEVSALLKGQIIEGTDGKRFDMDEVTIDKKAFVGNRRNDRHSETSFFHASFIPLEQLLADAQEQREDVSAKLEEGFQKRSMDRRGVLVADMGTNPQYAIDNMLSEGEEGDGFYVYELKPRGNRGLIAYHLDQDDSAVDFNDPFEESDRLQKETKDTNAAFSFYSRWNDPGSVGYAADPSTMDVVGKRWVSADQARKSPSVYNIR